MSGETAVIGKKIVNGRIIDREPSERKFIIGMLSPATLIFIIGIAFPLILSFYISIADSNTSHYLEFPPSKLHSGSQWFGNFAQFLLPGRAYSDTFYQYFYQTVFFVVVSVSLELFLGMLFALIVNRSFRGRAFARAALLVPWALPTIVSALVFRELFAPAENFGLVNTFLQLLGFKPIFFYGDPTAIFGKFAVPIPSNAFPFITFQSVSFSYGMFTLLIIEVWKTTPFIALLILAALQTVPNDLYKAADIEGATAFEKFRHITLPLIKDPLLIAVLFRLIDAVRVYDSVITLKDDTVYSVTVIAVNTWIGGDFGISAAIAIIELFMLVFFAIMIFKMSKNRLIFGAAAFLFLFSLLIPLSIELLQVFTTDITYLWIVLIGLTIIIFRKQIIKILSNLINALPEFKGFNVIVSLGIIIIEIIGFFIGLYLFVLLYDYLLSKSIIFLIAFFVLIPIVTFYKYRPAVLKENEKIFTRIALPILIIFTLIQIINQFSTVNDITLLSKVISGTKPYTYIVEVIFLALLFVLQIVLLRKISTKIKKAPNEQKLKEKINVAWLTILSILSLILQGYVISLEIISDVGIPLPGFILSLLPIQDTLNFFYTVLAITITIAFITTFGLLFVWYIIAIEENNAKKFSLEYISEIDHNVITYIALVSMFEVILYVLLQNDYQIYLLANFIAILSFIYYFREKIKNFSNQLEIDKINALLVLGIILNFEIILLFLQNTNFLLVVNLILVLIGFFYFRSSKNMQSEFSREFNANINQKMLLRNRKINQIGFGILVVFMLAFTLGPFLWMINRSFRNPCRSVNTAYNCYTAGPVQDSFELSPFVDTLMNFFNITGGKNTFSLQGYDIALNSQAAKLIPALINGFIVSGLTAIFVVFIGSFVAVILSKYHFRGERYIVLIIFSMSSLPPVIILIPYILQIFVLKNLQIFGFNLSVDIFAFNLKDFVLVLGSWSFPLGQTIEGLLTGFQSFLLSIPLIGPLLANFGNFLLDLFNSTNGRLLSLVLPYIAFNLPLGVFLIRSFFTNIPDELIKAAKVDGASNFQIFRKILLPLTRPGIFTTALMVFIQAWNELLFAQIFLSGSQNSFTVPLALLRFLLNPSQLSVPWVASLVLDTAAVIATLPLIILVLILQRYIISGITSGAVKG